MSHFDKTTLVAPYKTGNRLKIYLSDIEGNFKCTFGVVKSVDKNNKPTVEYEDLSGLKTNLFNRLVDVSKIIFKDKYEVHNLINKYL